MPLSPALCAAPVGVGKGDAAALVGAEADAGPGAAPPPRPTSSHPSESEWVRSWPRLAALTVRKSVGRSGAPPAPRSEGFEADDAVPCGMGVSCQGSVGVFSGYRQKFKGLTLPRDSLAEL
jgi:hypothetical protein